MDRFAHYDWPFFEGKHGALAREVEDRYASAHLFAEDLTRFLYVGFPTFTASRLSQLMATLFPTEVRRHSQVLDLPFVADVGGSDEESLAVMHREEFAPNPRESVILDLGQREPMTPPLSEPLRPRSPERGWAPGRRAYQSLAPPAKRQMITTAVTTVRSSMKKAPANPKSAAGTQTRAAETTSPIRAAFDRRIANTASSIETRVQTSAIPMTTPSMLTIVCAEMSS